MALKNVKQRVALILAGDGQNIPTVPGIGKVYARMRPVNVEQLEESDFVANGVLNCTFVTRGGTQLEQKGDIAHLVAQWDTVSVHTFYAVNDANNSEDAFSDLIDAMLWTIHQDSENPSYFAGTAARARKPEIKNVDFRHFGVQQALCHHAEITIEVLTRTN